LERSVAAPTLRLFAPKRNATLSRLAHAGQLAGSRRRVLLFFR
jgi:hypothetical protein